MDPRVFKQKSLFDTPYVNGPPHPELVVGGRAGFRWGTFFSELLTPMGRPLHAPAGGGVRADAPAARGWMAIPATLAF